MKKVFGRGLPLAAVLALGAQPGHGQAVYGSIFGTVTDTTGAVIPNATVTVLDTAKGTSTTVQSNASGDFSADHLIPDEYEVKVTATGFSGFDQTGIRVFADTSVKVSANMNIGSTGQTVQVNADQVPQLKTDRADVATIFNAQEIVDLPIPDRNFTNLQLLLPGAQLLGWSHAASENPQGSKQIEVDGQAFAGVAFQLDGTDNQDPILGIIVVNPNADSLSETKITTQNFDAEFGKAVSSVVTAQTKSGTNSFHGSLFDYRQSNANLARNPFTQPKGAFFPGGLKNQFGGSIGGPILKDKFFFFGDYQGVRQKVGVANQQTVPSAHLVSTCLGKSLANNGTAGCDFSEYATAVGLQNGLTPAQAANFQLIYQPNSSTPYAGNVIPAAQVSPQAMGLFSLLEPYTPNTVNSGPLGALVQNYSKGGQGGFNSNQWDVRLDGQISGKTHAFARFSRFTDTLTGTTLFGTAGGSGFGLGGYGGTSVGANDSTAAGVDIALNSTLVTDVRAGYFRYGINTSKYDQATPFATQLGIPGLNTAQAITSGAPGFIIAETGAFGGPNVGTAAGPQYGSGLNINRCNCPLVEHEDQYQIANNWTKTLGNHSVKFGADLRYARNLRVPSDNNRSGLLSFGTGPTSGGNGNAGLGFATFALGDVTTLQRYVSTTTNAKEFQKRAFFYAQDTWRATQKLTLNLGLRYEFYFPETVNSRANGALLNLSTGYLQVAGTGAYGTNMAQHTAPNTYNPRIGIAYQATPQTVIRAGYGRSFDIGVFGSIFGHSATQNLPVLANQSLTAPGGDNATDTNFAFNLAQGPAAQTFPTIPSNGNLPSPGYSVNARSRPVTLRLPTLDAWNLSVQQSLSPTFSFTISYVANKGTHTFGDASGNTLNPNEAAIVLPASNSVTGNQLHYDPSVDAATVSPSQGNVAGIAADGGTKNQNYLRRYYGTKLPACADPAYAANAAATAAASGTANPLAGLPAGVCGWTQDQTYFGDNLDTHYNALQVTLTKTLAHGVSLNANYAWQQSISEGTGYATWDKKVNRGRDSALRQQQIIVYGLVQLPFGRNKQFLNHSNAIINQAVSGWEINPVINYSSGLPYSLTSNQSNQWLPGSAPGYLNGTARIFKPHVTGFPGGSGASALQWYAPFQAGQNGLYQPGLDQVGNVGRDSFFGPHFFNTDLSVQKNFPIRERVQLQLRADGFNAFNHINWGTPNGTIQSGGQITQGPFPGNSANPRQLQFSGRVQF